MDRITLAIAVTSIYAVLYQSSILLGVREDFTVLLFAFSPFCLAYLVYMVLRFGKPSPHSFDQQFYDDWEYRRNGMEESQT